MGALGPACLGSFVALRLAMMLLLPGRDAARRRFAAGVANEVPAEVMSRGARGASQVDAGGWVGSPLASAAGSAVLICAVSFPPPETASDRGRWRRRPGAGLGRAASRV